MKAEAQIWCETRNLMMESFTNESIDQEKHLGVELGRVFDL